MPRMTTTEARKDFSDAVNRVAFRGERIEVFRRGKGVVGIVPFDEVKLLEQLEDLVLGEMARKSLKEKGGITLEQLRKKLKL
ncbi:MAG: type II toxin-antitoxin system Phd/YefM family antitoxin [Deltaproteobacteria bacterium]|nr:MAG: type II toxin-antitoxin system Phd/YefM family antitoxin [Deltaproteobacteria bacterium]